MCPIQFRLLKPILHHWKQFNEQCFNTYIKIVFSVVVDNFVALKQKKKEYFIDNKA